MLATKGVGGYLGLCSESIWAIGQDPASAGQEKGLSFLLLFVGFETRPHSFSSSSLFFFFFLIIIHFYFMCICVMPAFMSV